MPTARNGPTEQGLVAALVPTRVARADALRDPITRRIVAVLRRSPGGLTSDEIASSLGIEASSVRRRVRRLLQADVLVSSSGAPGGTGRPPRRLTLAPVSVRSERAGHAALTRLVARLVREGGFGLAAAEEFGRRHAHDLVPDSAGPRSIAGLLAVLGFVPSRAPRRGARREIELVRCPFGADRVGPPGEDVVCALHRGIVTGIGERLALPLELRGPGSGDSACARCRVVIDDDAAPASRPTTDASG